MGGWTIIVISIITVTAVCLFFSVTQTRRFYVIKKLAGESKLLSWLIPCAIVGACALVLFLTLGYVDAALCILLLNMFWAVCLLISFIVSKIIKRKFKLNYAGLAAILITVSYLGAGWYFAHTVMATEYKLNTEKNGGNVRIVQFADSHIGSLFNAEGFSKYVEEMNGQKPDLVLITGDFVDDDTTREDMLGACRALSAFTPTYGVYYVFGNHDTGYYSEISRGWTTDEFVSALKENGVIVLEDEAVVIDGRINLIGRRDGKVKDRKSIAQLTEGLDMNRYTVVMDHQPNDYTAEAKAGVDLVLSGHTHGGQYFPINVVVAFSNDMVYGHKKVEGTDFIVTSGIADWTIKFKIGCLAEYVVADVCTD